MDTKDRIMKTADQLFYFQGYQSTGINQIIKEANIAKGSLYNHFKSKSELGQAYAMQASELWFKGLEEELNLWSTPSEKLLSVFSFLDRYAKSNNFNGCKLINILTEITDKEENIRKITVDHKQKFRNYLQQISTELFTDPNLAVEVSDSIYMLYEAATVECKIFKSSWPISLAKKNAEQILILKSENTPSK
ncbi:TetR/AcrR family transcriptional regulator [Chryseobacterium sp.]|jgi:AcrR family transcriptional regulator|uniref:TetR/AcrR family transcriptional regulator n=1 Tax=Chryseobacterium sp. TaxID=1871047 RepID=UPI00284F57B4|nr:TetR/AcrR family transcriptional regulator [Chryseobacterium sp.]MDR3023496.1 TetR/AcrR family transcriptional regulator [Chryseobacterium sp.]